MATLSETLSSTEKRNRIEPEQDHGGKWIVIGTKLMKIPPLGFRAIRELQGDVEGLRNISGMPDAEQIESVISIFHAAVKRNYPALGRETVADMIDISNYADIMDAVLGISGFRRSTPGEALAQSNPSTGMPSTAISSIGPDGPGNTSMNS